MAFQLLCYWIFLQSFYLLRVQGGLCPAPFSIEAGKCVFASTSQSHSWCSANQQCASIGGELINSYSSLLLLGSMSSLNCGCFLWLGVSDMADEKKAGRVGWQMIKDKGILQLNNALWQPGDPNNLGGIQDCVSTAKGAGQIVDLQCSSSRGFACEFTPYKPQASIEWKRTPFKRTSYNPSDEYCYTDLMQVKNSMYCIAAAMRAGNSRHVLYNSKMKTCRLLLFTDAQVEETIETSDDWVKFSVH